MKYKIMQQVAKHNGLGGPSKALSRLMQSEVMSCFDMRILEQTTESKKNVINIIKNQVKELREYQPDLVHVRGVQTDAMLCLIACKIAKVPHTIMSINGMTSDLVRLNRLKRMIFQYIIEPICFRLTDSAFTVYQKGLSRPKIKKYKKKLCGYVYNPMPEWDCSLKSNISDSIRKEYKINKDDKVALCVSRISYEKGFSYIIEAVHKMRNNWPQNLKIMIVGSGAYKEMLSSELTYEVEQGRIILVEGTADVKKFYFTANVFFTASLHENHSNAILEACAAHIPVIATDVGGNAESILNGKGGWIIQPRNVDDIVKAFDEVSKTSLDDLKKMGEYAHSMGREKFEINKIYSKLASLYESVIKC